MERPDLEKFTCSSTPYSIALEEYADFKEKQAEELKKYADHKLNCPAHWFTPITESGKCTCGLEQELKE